MTRYNTFTSALQQVFSLIFIITALHANAQTYPDHIGTGNNIGISISTSDTQGENTASETLSGTGYIHDMANSARFLSQAAFGGNYEEIQHVSKIGVDAWLDEQFKLQSANYLDRYTDIRATAEAMIRAKHGEFEGFHSDAYLKIMFYEKLFTEDDILRQKVAFALSQIFVVSIQSSQISSRGYGLCDYYDVLYNNAFGNYRDLLGKVTLHPTMGAYLSSFKNRKANPEKQTLPDENYAREVMQLFSIGLHELNEDGTAKLDNNGENIPTYNLEDIQELAKVFTGLSGGAYDLDRRPNLEGKELVFYRGKGAYDFTVPMVMYEDYHEQASKTLIDGTVLPAGQSGMEDINQALDVLFKHENVGPFIGYRLIQQLVKSNPSPAYIKRVAMVFNNNGKGERGDLKAVIRAIFTDPEARNCNVLADATSGKMLQPMERFVQLYKAFNVSSPSGRLWLSPYFYKKLEQDYLSAPSVFNFFSPFYAESKHVAPNEMVSPEFQILNSVTTINYINMVEQVVKYSPIGNYSAAHDEKKWLKWNAEDKVELDFSREIKIYEEQGTAALLDHLSLMLCHGQLSDKTKAIILDTLKQYDEKFGHFDATRIIKEAIYFLMVSPDYVILK